MNTTVIHDDRLQFLHLIGLNEVEERRQYLERKAEGIRALTRRSSPRVCDSRKLREQEKKELNQRVRKCREDLVFGWRDFDVLWWSLDLPCDGALWSAAMNVRSMLF